MTPPLQPGYARFPVHCTVYGCTHHGNIDVHNDGEPFEVLQRIAIAGLHQIGWGMDYFGVLCPPHIPTHKIGRLRPHGWALDYALGWVWSHCIVVASAMRSRYNTLGRTVIGPTFTPITTSPIPDADVADMLADIAKNIPPCSRCGQPISPGQWIANQPDGEVTHVHCPEADPFGVPF